MKLSTIAPCRFQAAQAALTLAACLQLYSHGTVVVAHEQAQDSAALPAAASASTRLPHQPAAASASTRLPHQPADASASTRLPHQPADASASTSLSNRPPDVPPERELQPAQQSQTIPLVGGIARFEPHSLIGKWNGHIRKFGRHPKLFIDKCENGQIAGTYKGLIGECPVHGSYDDITGDIRIIVDLTGSRLRIIRKLKSARQGFIEARVTGDNLTGIAFIPELGSHRVKWEATKYVE